jgi:hypothetical protein
MRIPRSLTFHDQIRMLRIIYFALIVTQGFLFIVAWILKNSIKVSSETENALDYIIPLILFGAIFTSRYLYRNLTTKARSAQFIKKLETYRNSVILSLAVLETANITAILAFMITGEYLYAAASVIMFLLFILNSPTEYKFRSDLELTPDELSHTE